MLQLYNAGSIQIEPYAPMETIGKNGTLAEIAIRAPSAASMSQLLINGPSPIPAGSSAAIPDNWPRWVAISGDDPSPGDDIGCVASAAYMQGGNTGFLCLVMDADANIALCRPAGGGGSATMDIIQAVSDGASGSISTKALTLKADLSLSPNYTQSSGTTICSYFKL